MTVTEKAPALIEKEALSALSLVALRERPGHGISNGATFSSALDALQSNRIRSLLTMLGVIIGVSAVIAVVTLTQGVSKSVNDRFTGLGTNVLTVSPGTTSSSGARSAAGSSQTLTVADAEALTQIPSVVEISPIVNATEQLVYADQNWNTRVTGVYPDYQTIQNWQIASGAWFSDQDEQMGQPVAVLGDTVAQNLFPSTSGIEPIGQTIRVGNSLFRVVGVLQPKGAQGTGNADDVVFVPFSAAKERLNPSPYVGQIQVQIDSINDVAQAQLDITALLRSRHHLRGPDPSLQQQARTGQGPSLFGGGGGGGNRGGGGGGGGAPGGVAVVAVAVPLVVAVVAVAVPLAVAAVAAVVPLVVAAVVAVVAVVPLVVAVVALVVAVALVVTLVLVVVDLVVKERGVVREVVRRHVR